MNAVIFDTNVLIVANGKTEQASANCILSCINALEKARNEQLILLDTGQEILTEYRNQASLSGQPGLGDAFLRWLWENQANDSHCEQVLITPDAAKGYVEFPDTPELQKFDRSDRKFVAVSIASRKNPEILNAVDSDWWDFRNEFSTQKIEVRFLCPGQFNLS